MVQVQNLVARQIWQEFFQSMHHPQLQIGACPSSNL